MIPIYLYLIYYSFFVIGVFNKLNNCFDNQKGFRFYIIRSFFINICCSKHYTNITKELNCSDIRKDRMLLFVFFVPYDFCDIIQYITTSKHERFKPAISMLIIKNYKTYSSNELKLAIELYNQKYVYNYDDLFFTDDSCSVFYTKKLHKLIIDKHEKEISKKISNFE